MQICGPRTDTHTEGHRGGPPEEEEAGAPRDVRPRRGHGGELVRTHFLEE